MKTVVLMRHGDAPFDDDFERNLSALGQQEAANIGTQLQNFFDTNKENVPDYILCSWTSRTKDTLKECRDHCEDLSDVQARALQQLEFASPQMVLEMLMQLDDSVDSVMVIGHDTYLAFVARTLAVKDDHKNSLCRMFGHAHCAILECASLEQWDKMQKSTFSLKAGFQPKL